MKNKLKKIIVWSVSITAFLAIVLAIHIYVVTRPKVNAQTVVMARMDIKQSLTQDDAAKIANWLYQQKGVNHVLVNPKTDIVIFTFYPLKTSANQVVSDFNSNLNYKAARFMPTEAQVDASCPAVNSMAFKVSKFFQKLF